MNTVPLIGVLLLFALAVVGSAWYLAFRVRTTFGLRRRWLLRRWLLRLIRAQQPPGRARSGP